MQRPPSHPPAQGAARATERKPPLGAADFRYDRIVDMEECLSTPRCWVFVGGVGLG